MLDRFGVGKAYVEAERRSLFVVDAHLTYAREVAEGDPLRFVSRVLGADGKRLHLFHEMLHADGGWLAATAEFMLLHVDLTQRRACSFPDGVAAVLAAQAAVHGRLPRPPQAGRAVGRLGAAD